MHVEFATVPAELRDGCAADAAHEAAGDGGLTNTVSWVGDGRTYCWMDAGQMASVGITAGVKKVIAAVSAGARGKQPAGGKKAAGAKRKADAVNDAQQPKMSNFFGPKGGT